MPQFIKGLELGRLYFEEVVKPILDTHYSELVYASGLIGRGSEVLGFDDPMSTDHDWGPSLTVFLQEHDAQLAPLLSELMDSQLPDTFRGYPTRFQFLSSTGHRVQFVTVRDYFLLMLAWDSDSEPDIIDWLTFSSQKLRALTSGAIFHDGVGEVSRVRTQLAWYPSDLWLYLMAMQWDRIGQEEHLMGRAGYRGDDIGATLMANRLVSDMMRLCFLMEEQYAPYPKWFGTAFQELEVAKDLSPVLRRMQLAENWQERQSAYARIVELMTEKHNQLKLTDLLPVSAQSFHDRPFLVSHADAISVQLKASITDEDVKRLVDLPTPIGSIDQISDETTLKEYPAWRERLKALYYSGG